MKIGIIVAMDKEFAQLQTLATDKNKESHAHYDFVTGRIGDNEVIMMQCGIGKVNAAIGADQLIIDYCRQRGYRSSAATILTSSSPPVWLVEPTQALR